MPGSTTASPKQPGTNTGTAGRRVAPGTSGAASGKATRCAQCGAVEDWGKASWCPKCGYYPVLGTRVAVEEEPQVQEGAASLGDLFPAWARVLAFGAGAIMVINLWLRLGILLDEERAMCALVEAGLGLILVLVGHSAAFLYGVTKSDALSPFDYFLKPLASWKPAIQALPDHAWRVWVAGWGLTAIVSGLAIIGGVRYSAVFDDWGFAKRAQPTIIQAVVDQARQQEGEAESLEDAMNEFTGQPGEEKLPQNYTRTDCLIFGYLVSDTGEVRSILLAGVVDSKLRYVGKLSFADLPPEVQSSLHLRFQQLGCKSSFVKVPFAGRWLEPRLMCTVAYAGWGDDKLMRFPRFVQMLADAKR